MPLDKVARGIQLGLTIQAKAQDSGIFILVRIVKLDVLIDLAIAYPRPKTSQPSISPCR